MRQLVPLLALVLVIGFMYLSFTNFNIPVIFFGDKNSTIAAIQSNTPLHVGKGIKVQSVKFKYLVDSVIYEGDHNFSRSYGPLFPADPLKIEYEIHNPEKYRMVGLITEEVVIPEAILPTLWLTTEMYQPTLLVFFRDESTEAPYYLESLSHMDFIDWPEFLHDALVVCDTTGAVLKATTYNHCLVETKYGESQFEYNDSLKSPLFFFYDEIEFRKLDSAAVLTFLQNLVN